MSTTNLPIVVYLQNETENIECSFFFLSLSFFFFFLEQDRTVIIIELLRYLPLHIIIIQYIRRISWHFFLSLASGAFLGFLGTCHSFFFVDNNLYNNRKIVFTCQFFISYRRCDVAIVLSHCERKLNGETKMNKKNRGRQFGLVFIV